MESRHEDALSTTDRRCAECGNTVATSWQPHTFQYGIGASAAELEVRLPVRRCDRCDFDYLDDEGERLKHEAVCRHLGVLTPREIRGIRERHGLSRQAFAAVTGIGEASLGRWENGIKVQTLGYDKYLRLLGRPGVLALPQVADGPLPHVTNQRPFRRIEVTEVLLQRQQSFHLLAA